MSKKTIKGVKTPSRRKFFKAAAATGAAAAATVAMPNIAFGAPKTLKMQAAWPSGANIFFEMAGDYAKMVSDMSGGQLKIDLQPVGSVVKTGEIGQAVSSGVLDMGHWVTAYWYGKNAAASLFGTGPSYGMSSHEMTFRMMDLYQIMKRQRFYHTSMQLPSVPYLVHLNLLLDLFLQFLQLNQQVEGQSSTGHLTCR